ncbi:MAG: slipin family protein [Ignavibacteria bacterium]|nr:slipin family protein [Ignavibacteria bacterium]MBT8381812.1 slipin family protein [Ignavibacteria bacterium]MBT8392488.1 slipin family protein [Ignavibacteria bacterium]NNJ53565.1 slipin family protein [Ignavibacteriaceae bacterium]NNL22067.1 slipin family protein [Ignavibacteriaceae bacterium]
MAFFNTKFKVRQNEIGFLYDKYKFIERLETGVHTIPSWGKELELISLPTNSKLISVVNQEVLTKDNIALRFSFNIQYKIIDGEKFLGQVTHGFRTENMFTEIEHRLSNLAQVIVRSKISEIESEFLNEKRNELANLKTEEMEKQANELGITIEQATIKDITFPKNIQDVFITQIESKIRAKADLENARTAVASARALKNAADIMKDDDNIKFHQLLETITKIAAKGKHSFNINFGELQNQIDDLK